MLDKRLGQLAEGDKAWLKAVGDDGRMHGAMDTMGTIHGRAAHFSPNMGQNANPEWGFVYDKFFSKGQSDRAVGSLVRKSFDERLNLGKLHKRLKKVRTHKHAFTGHLPGLDGRWVPCRSDHSALNFALSSAEAILCKQWICDAHDALIAKGYKWGWDGDFVFILWVHDELQVACKETIAEEVGQTLVQCAKEAGVKLGFRVELDSEFKKGRNWSETH